MPRAWHRPAKEAFLADADRLSANQSAATSVLAMPEEDLSSPAERWTTLADDVSPRRAEMRRLADAGRQVIERMATTDAPHAVIERAAELLEAAAQVLDGPGKVRTYAGFAESANAGGAPTPTSTTAR